MDDKMLYEDSAPLTIEQVESWRAAWWDGPFQKAKNRLCDFIIASLRTPAAREGVLGSARLELTIRQAVIDWNRAHDPLRLEIDNHEEGDLAEVILERLRALKSSPERQPEGMVLVPKEPTQEMHDAGVDRWANWDAGPNEIYLAMLAAHSSTKQPIQGETE